MKTGTLTHFPPQGFGQDDSTFASGVRRCRGWSENEDSGSCRFLASGVEVESLVECRVMVGGEGTATWGERPGPGHDGVPCIDMSARHTFVYSRAVTTIQREKALAQGDTRNYKRLPCPTVSEAPSGSTGRDNTRYRGLSRY